MKPYVAYRHSRVERLPNVPHHWDIVALNRLGTFKSGAGFPVGEQGLVDSEIPFFKVSDMNLPGNEEVLRTWNNSISRDTADQLGAFVFPAGSILFPKVGGALLTNKRRVTEQPSCIDNNLMGCMVKEANPEFMLRVLEHIDLGSIVKPGPVPAISEGEVQEIRVAIPPPKEQAAIVRFLDHADEQIQRYIAGKERVIALLEEEYKVATWEAIRSPRTKSLRLEVAADWVRRPVTRSAEETYIPVGLYNRGRGIFQKEPTKGSDLGDSDFFWIQEGDLVISGQFAWEGAIGLADPTIDGCVASHRYPILQGKPGISDPRFLLMFFQTEWGQLLLDNHSRGAAGRNRPLNIRTLLKEKIALPHLDDQLHLARMLDNQLRLRQQTRVVEERLNEYRTRLIADVVTGQLDVREAAKNLPDPRGEEQPFQRKQSVSDSRSP